MSDENTNPEGGAQQPAAQGADAQKTAAPKMNVLTQFIRDMSFENILAQRGTGGEVTPDVQVAVNLDAKKRSQEHQFEVATKLNITSRNKGSEENLFLLELEYVGVFHIENVPDDQMHPFLLIECPRMVFPFVRRIVSDITRDGGFPPLNLETIDFVQLYRNEIMRRQAEASKGDIKHDA
ncbi:protein-export chaperone SecB [Roseovarius aestuariivivens]|uniref:protein-export chaperone SecB n=1 Tax=Roseovarius aestuariivivens TaxID=1888910 RepID=UPI001080B8ED|nr:protein-export chaperone SecB [Roseovarius aestuariivivens]